MIKNLLDEIISRGDRGAVVPVSRIDDLKRDMYDLQNGDYHTGFMDWMAGSADRFIPSGLDFEPKSVISIVKPDSKFILRFDYRGKTVECIVPPLYINEDVKFREALQYINDYLNPLGFKAAGAGGIPNKLLAVHCGLGLYGRNNLFYSHDFGSYAQLLSFVSDMPCDEDETESLWVPAGRMEACENCFACVTSCPTNAIDPNQRIINADICLTAMNEMNGEFPDWLDKNAHHAVIGCLKCQDCCPANARNIDHIKDGLTFTEDETMELLNHLNHKNDEPYSDLLISKINAAGLSGWGFWPQALPRNLAVLLDQ